jgi:calcium-dependent protein kinase
MTTKNVKSDDIVISIEKIDNKGFIKRFSDLFKIKKQLAFGPKGSNYKVEDLKRNNEIRMVKMMKKASGINSLTLTELQIDSLLSLNHPNIGMIYDILEDEKFIYMVQDLNENGDLFNFIMKNKNINENLCKEIIKQLLSAVRYLHENNIMHRGIKPQNIFIIKFIETDVNQTMLKLCDFGSALYFKDCVPFSDFSGNPAYSAPEVIKGKYDNRADIWSIGVIAYFLLTGTTPYQGKEYDILFKVK